jgi:hypothetical protein
MIGFWIGNHQERSSSTQGQSKHIDMADDGVVKVCHDNTLAMTVVQAKNGPIEKLANLSLLKITLILATHVIVKPS